jgi:hypothetical protein
MVPYLVRPSQRDFRTERRHLLRIPLLMLDHDDAMRARCVSAAVRVVRRMPHPTRLATTASGRR